jgi:hypothetical protein
MHGIFTDEEWKKHKKTIIMILVVCFLIGLGVAIYLNHLYPGGAAEFWSR